MAERRMFAKLIVNSDEFLDLPISSQVLYFHLVMQADDDGMINNARRIILMMGLDQKDLQLLIDNRFLISFDSGILAVRHWKQQNRIRSDRYKPTVYQEEFSQLVLLKDKTYALVIPDGNQMSKVYPVSRTFSQTRKATLLCISEEDICLLLCNDNIQQEII